MSWFTAEQVCNIVSNDDPNDPEFLYDGSDDDLAISEEDELLQDCPNEDYDPTMIDTTMLVLRDSSATPGTPYSTPSRAHTHRLSHHHVFAHNLHLCHHHAHVHDHQSEVVDAAGEVDTGVEEEAVEEVQQVDKEVLHITMNEFTESVGPTFPLSSEPIDAFLKLFPVQLIN